MASDDLQFDMEFAKFDSSWATVKSAYLPERGAQPVNRHRDGKRMASGASSAASVGLSGAQLATGTSALTVGGAVLAGAAVSATGIGLVAAAAALTIGSMANNVRSLAKTIGHCENLKAIQRRYGRGEYRNCECLADARGMQKDHDWIGTKVLPYIISQKTEKAAKKAVGSIGAGLLTTAYSMGRWAYKSLASTKGVKRGFYAHVLARHLITHECPLAEQIVAELLSPAEMASLKQENSDVVGAAIKDKMKSV
jgi:hypothetical protein